MPEPPCKTKGILTSSKIFLPLSKSKTGSFSVMPCKLPIETAKKSTFVSSTNFRASSGQEESNLHLSLRRAVLFH